VTVKKAGYLTKTKCEQVESGVPNYNSVALEAGEDPPPTDAGVPNDGDVPLDSEPGDAGGRPDAGAAFDGPGGGCCDAGSKPETTGILVLLVAFWVYGVTLRRRGTTAVR
jgi:hypothetical protein